MPGFCSRSISGSSREIRAKDGNTKGQQNTPQNQCDILARMLKGFFDDSGKWLDRSETVVVVAGAIADVDQWEIFAPKWKLVLNEFQVSELHMRDFAHFRGDYIRWTEPKRQDFIGQLLALAKTHIKKPIGALLPKSQFEELPHELQQKWLGDPYFVCLWDTIGMSVDVAAELYDQDLEIVCDDQPKLKGKGKQVYHACKKYLLNRERLNGFEFASSEDVPGLQLADLIAYEALQLQRSRLAGTLDIDKFRWPGEQIIDKFMTDFEFYSLGRLVDRQPPKFFD